MSTPDADPPSQPPTNVDDAVPPPVLFNCFKHHAREIAARITASVAAGEPTAAFAERLIVLGTGDQPSDLYLGAAAPADLAAEATTRLADAGAGDRGAFTRWVGEAGGYRTLTFGDGCDWVFRVGDVPDRWVHMHPGRYATHTIRAKTIHLRTAVTALHAAGATGADPFALDLVNAARADHLGLPPIPDLPRDVGLGRIIGLLQNAHG
jgi:hypothetical protein